MKPWQVAMCVVAAWAAILVAVEWASEGSDCEDRGGAFVRSWGWWECVEKRP